MEIITQQTAEADAVKVVVQVRGEQKLVVWLVPARS
jgi:hypothetical protein